MQKVLRKAIIQTDEKLYNVAIDIKSLRLVNKIMEENPDLLRIIDESEKWETAVSLIKDWVLTYFDSNPTAFSYYRKKTSGNKALKKLDWRDYAAIRIMDYLDYTGRIFTDPNIKLGKTAVNNPFRLLYMAARYGTGGARYDFFLDMLYLFRQFSGKLQQSAPGANRVKKWMARHPSGLEENVIAIRNANKRRIMGIIIMKIDEGTINDKRYYFDREETLEEKLATVEKWWNESLFHLRFAIRNPDYLNEMLNYSLSPETLHMLRESMKKGIPLFINPYYLSLLNINLGHFTTITDSVIRDYVMPNKELLNEFGRITAWEKEDIIEPGKPNAAGWLLPNDRNVHRRYPEVAILIPDTGGRACGGLCVSCQRMFDFQNGVLNFNLEKLKPRHSWPDKLRFLMDYFRNDSQLRDILITGGDALMSTDKSLQLILDEIYEMARKKKEDNLKREKGKKYAEMVRIRLGTRLPVYLPQRVTPELAEILKDFRDRASRIGFRQFVVQTHFQTAMEITPEVVVAIKRIHEAGWVVVNQMVFTAAASTRGHTAKLRQTLNRTGIISYYTFTVKGFLENSHNFAPNARSVQERSEEKVFGTIPKSDRNSISNFTRDTRNMAGQIEELKQKLNVPFLASDRNVLNLPGVGKSMTYRVVGITRYGKRILQFDHDRTRKHSPVIDKMGKVYIVESKSIKAYLNQMDDLGEDTGEYKSIWGYSLGETEARLTLYDYPEYDYKITDEVSHFEMPEINTESL
jgi:lysine 2,3-aminomutase